MSNFKLNGNVQTQGHLYELNLKGNTLSEITKQAEHDGLDQIFFEAEGKAYVMEADGLDFSSLKRQSFPKGTLDIDGKTVPIKNIIIDNEVNTAREGLSSVGKATWGLTIGSIGGGTALSLSGIRGAQAGIVMTNTGLKTVQESAELLGSHLNNARMSVDMAVKQQAFAKQVSGLPQKMIDKMFKGKRPDANWPTDLSQIKVAPKAAGDLGSKQIAALEAGNNKIQQGLQQTAKGNQTLRTGLKVVAIGAAVVGTVAAGGMLYGALRSEDEQSLDAYKQKPEQLPETQTLPE